MSPACIINVKIDGKNVQLVTQSRDQLRVFVNPSRNGADEWQVPAGIGPRVSVFSPEPKQQARAGPTESSSASERTPARQNPNEGTATIHASRGKHSDPDVNPSRNSADEWQIVEFTLM